LSGHADQVAALLGKAGVVENPGLDRSHMLEGGQNVLAHHGEHGRVAPCRLGNQVRERLVGGLNMLPIEPGRHRFDPLARSRQQQAGTVAAQRVAPISMADHFTQRR
jgi:hypothetical protein